MLRCMKKGRCFCGVVFLDMKVKEGYNGDILLGISLQYSSIVSCPEGVVSSNLG